MNDDGSRAIDHQDSGLFGMEHHTELGYDEVGMTQEWLRETRELVDESYGEFFSAEYLPDSTRITNPNATPSQKISGNLLWGQGGYDTQDDPANLFPAGRLQV